MTMANAAGNSLADHLMLAQWLSPAFPIGAYAYSQGLEAAISMGAVTDEAALEAWVLACLTHGTPRMDAILLAHARRGGDLGALADLAAAFAGGALRAREMADQGHAFGAALAAIAGQELAQVPDLPIALALGAATARLSLPDDLVIAQFLSAGAAQLISAAVRFMPLGQAAGQRVQARVAAQIPPLARALACAGLDDIATATLGADLAAMAQETLEVRIFRS